MVAYRILVSDLGTNLGFELGLTGLGWAKAKGLGPGLDIKQVEI